jgi:hypothetical protein
MGLAWGDLVKGRKGNVSRTAVAFLAWFVFLLTIISVSMYKSTDSKLPELPQSYVYLTVVFCGTYTARRYLDGKTTEVPPANEPPKTP